MARIRQGMTRAIEMAWQNSLMKAADMTMRTDESVKAGLLRLADALIDAAQRCAVYSGSDPTEDIHFLRMTTKRLRAMLQLIRPMIGKTAFARENACLKKAACQLASSRDHVVAGRTLKALSKSVSGSFPSAMLVDKVGVQSCLAESSQIGDSHLAMSQAADDLEKARTGLYRMRIKDEGWIAIGPGLLKVYRQGRRLMRAAFAHPDDQAFHRWRIRVKYLFYQLEWLEPVWPRRFALLCRRLHKLEEKLGDDHDLAVLRTMLEKESGPFDSPDAIRRIEKSINRKSKRLRRSSKSLGAEIFGEKPGKFGRKCRQHWKAWQDGS